MLGNNLDEVKNQNNNVKVTKTVKKVLNSNSENPEIVEETVYYDKDEVEKFNNFEKGDFKIDENATNVKKDVTVEEDENGTITKVVNIEYSLLEDDINNEGDIIIETSIINDGTERTEQVEQGEKSFITNMDSVIIDEAGGISLIETKEKFDRIGESTTNIETDNLSLNPTEEKVEEKADRSYIEQVKSVFTGRGKNSKQEENKPKITTTKRVYSKDIYSFEDQPSQTEEIIEIVQPQVVEEKIETPVDDDEYVSAPEEDNSTFFSNFKVNVPKKETVVEEEVVENDEANKSGFFRRFKFNIPGRKKEDSSVNEEVVEEGVEPKIETIEKSVEEPAVDGETSTTTEVVVDPETGKKKTVTKKVTRKVVTKSFSEDVSENQDGETSTTEIVVDPVTGKKKYVTKRVIRKLISKNGPKEEITNEPSIIVKELPGGITETTELVVDPVTEQPERKEVIETEVVRDPETDEIMYITRRVVTEIITLVEDEESDEEETGEFKKEKSMIQTGDKSMISEKDIGNQSFVTKAVVTELLVDVESESESENENEVVSKQTNTVVNDQKEVVEEQLVNDNIENIGSIEGKQKKSKKSKDLMKKLRKSFKISKKSKKNDGSDITLTDVNKREESNKNSLEQGKADNVAAEVSKSEENIGNQLEHGKTRYIKRIIRYRINPETGEREIIDEPIEQIVKKVITYLTTIDPITGERKDIIEGQQIQSAGNATISGTKDIVEIPSEEEQQDLTTEKVITSKDEYDEGKSIIGKLQKLTKHEERTMTIDDTIEEDSYSGKELIDQIKNALVFEDHETKEISDMDINVDPTVGTYSYSLSEDPSRENKKNLIYKNYKEYEDFVDNEKLDIIKEEKEEKEKQYLKRKSEQFVDVEKADKVQPKPEIKTKVSKKQMKTEKVIENSNCCAVKSSYFNKKNEEGKVEDKETEDVNDYRRSKISKKDSKSIINDDDEYDLYSVTAPKEYSYFDNGSTSSKSRKSRKDKDKDCIIM
ncbi:hypothetical protein PIROE2DRAFT_68788 [Piromyces sp. E2]|nr:hypothetical protein PIROE2DRAFT_68788 [Piromyces sp. E2]|eukprot:OUM67704.1 hypothetical protein PIROE2DRAFT_68788 [Piromyces sp. E2]